MSGLRTPESGYCVPCFFFCKGDEGLEKLVNSPLTRFKDAVETFLHSRKTYHIHSVSDMLTFMHHQLVSAVAQQVQQNRELLKSIIKTVIFCGKHLSVDTETMRSSQETMAIFMPF